MMRRLILEVGFGWAMRSAAFLILGLMICANLTLRSRLPPRGPTPWSVNELTRPFKELPYTLCCLGSFLFFFGYLPTPLPTPPFLQKLTPPLPACFSR